MEKAQQDAEEVLQRVSGSKSKLGFTATPVQAMAWKTLAYHQKNLYIYSIYQRDSKDFRFMYRHMVFSLLLPPWSVECSSSDCQSSQAKRPKSGPRRINKLLKSSWQIKSGRYKNSGSQSIILRKSIVYMQ